MKLTNQQIANYVDRIKFSTSDKSYYKSQIKNLIDSLSSYLLNHSNVSVQKVIQAGSWKKATILKPNLNTTLDIDLAFYINLDKIDDILNFHELNETIVLLLQKIYPNKSDEDFIENPKTANVKFITSGLSVDIVPVIDAPPDTVNNLNDYVYQPDSDTYTFYVTSIKNQLSFIIDRKNSNKLFASTVRILKEWKNIQKLSLSSFAVELIVSYLDINKGVLEDIEESLLRFFTLLSNKNFPEISFNAPYGRVSRENSFVYIADPTNNSNNVVKYISKSDWKAIQEASEAALETIVYAQEKKYKYETLALWNDIFDSSFNIEPKAQNI